MTTTPPDVSPYIAESLRRQAMIRKQQQVLDRALQAFADDLGMPVEWAKYVTPKAQQRHKNRVYQSREARRARLSNAVTETIRRSEIIERDRSTCYLCGQRCEPNDIHLDHVIPLSRGGSHTAANLRVTHGQCNIRKAANLLPTDTPATLPSRRSVPRTNE